MLLSWKNKVWALWLKVGDSLRAKCAGCCINDPGGISLRYRHGQPCAVCAVLCLAWQLLWSPSAGAQMCLLHKVQMLPWGSQRESKITETEVRCNDCISGSNPDGIWKSYGEAFQIQFCIVMCLAAFRNCIIKFIFKP